MFRKNTKHQQPALISAASELPEKQRKRLEKSWAGIFYKELFSRINEEAFSEMYSEKGSRPNVPVNVLVGLEALKAGKGWSDAELYENYCFNLQVRYALGYDKLGEGDFEIRSLYYFRERLSKYNKEKGINLLEKAFEEITDEQIAKLKIKTGMQRMDSTQIASNIVFASRLQMLVESIRRIERILGEKDRIRLEETLAPYVKNSAGGYTYRLNGKEEVQTHLQQTGENIHTLLRELKSEYESETAYQVLERMFTENFEVLENELRTKDDKELGSGSLQSVDDLEATYRLKGARKYKGYVSNITETCDPANKLQLITKVQVAANNINDNQLLDEALPNLVERTDLKILYTDGGYGGPEEDQDLMKKKIKQIQTGIRGRKLNKERLDLSDFEIEQSEEGIPTQIVCPQGQTVPVKLSSQKKGYTARFEEKICEACPLMEKCRTKKGKRYPGYHLRFSPENMTVSQRRRRSLHHRKSGQNLRAAVEATVREVKHPFSASKLPVRGRFRVTCMMIASAMTANVRRIHRWVEDERKELNKLNKDQMLPEYC